MNLYTVKFFSRAIKYGSKYVYQTIPRLLTIWLDMGESPVLMGSDIFRKLNAIVAKAIRETPAYKVIVCLRHVTLLNLFPVVHGVPSNCFPRRSRKPRGVLPPIQINCNSVTRIPGSSSMVLYVRGEIYKDQSRAPWQANSRST